MSQLFLCITVKALKSQTLFFLFSNKMLLFRTGSHKMHVKIANREDPDQLLLQRQSDLGLLCLSIPFLYQTSVRNLQLFTIALIRAAASIRVLGYSWI